MLQDFNSSTFGTVNFTLAQSPLKPNPNKGNAVVLNKSISNLDYKEGKTIKTLTYAMGKGVIMLRVANLEDRFDGTNNSKSYDFDINAFANPL